MNKRQQLAIENHARFAFESINPKLIYRVPTGLVILCVASGHE